MPNATAQIVFYLWPLVVFILFRKLPITSALVWSIVAGYLLLPNRTGFNLPMIPTVNKDALPAIIAAIMCILAVRAQARAKLRQRMMQASTGVSIMRETSVAVPRRPKGLMLINLLLVVLFTSPLLTIATNSERIFAGPRVIGGLELYDGLSMIGNQLFVIIPFLLARRFIASPESHVILLRIFCIAGLAYSILALYEVRMSPQLNVDIYGFFAHSFRQHIRAGGFRPIVFLHHGLWLGIFFAMSILAGAALTRCKATADQRWLWRIAAFWLLGVLFLCKSVGAFVIAVLLLPAALLLKVRGQLLLAAILAGIVLLYPMVRGAGWVPTERIYNTALKFSEERAASLAFRLRHEDALLERANEKPLAGWGSWGRNMVYDPVTGESTSVSDGIWVIVIGTSGWVGYIARFGLVTLPIIFLALQHRRRKFGFETSGLALVLVANLVDLLPNATLTPLTWLVSGALLGRYAYQAQNSETQAEPVEATSVPAPRPTVMVRSRRGESPAEHSSELGRLMRRKARPSE